jgi:hypothetical protein
MDGDEIGPFNVGNPGEFTMLELANVSVVQHDCVRGQPLRCVAPCHVCKPGFMSVLASVSCCAICGLGPAPSAQPSGLAVCCCLPRRCNWMHAVYLLLDDMLCC